MQVINNHEHIKTLISEEGQTTKICVDIPSAFNLNHIENIEDAYSYIVELTPIVKNISNQAFIQKQDKSWAQIQNMLYFWNYKDLTRKNRINDYSALIEHALRKSILTPFSTLN